MKFLTRIFYYLFPKTMKEISDAGYDAGYAAREKQYFDDRAIFIQVEKNQLFEDKVISVSNEGNITIGYITDWLNEKIPCVSLIGEENQTVWCFGITIPYHPLYIRALQLGLSGKELYVLLSRNRQTGFLKNIAYDDELYNNVWLHQFMNQFNASVK